MPTTIAFLWTAHSAAMAGVALCELKSMTTSPCPITDSQVVPLVNLADDLQVGMMGGAGDERPAHAALGTGDDDFGHT